MHCKKTAQTEVLLSENIPKRGWGGLLDSKTPGGSSGNIQQDPKPSAHGAVQTRSPKSFFPRAFFFSSSFFPNFYPERLPQGLEGASSCRKRAQFPTSPPPKPKNTKSYSRGTEVAFRAPTQRSLCFFLWLMYCKILTGSPSLPS